jgi:hypothetical protein
MFRVTHITKLLRQISLTRAGYAAKLLVTYGALQDTPETVGKKCLVIQHPWKFSIAIERYRSPSDMIGLSSTCANH